MALCVRSLSLFFFNYPPPTEIYTLSLHDALPVFAVAIPAQQSLDRKSVSKIVQARAATGVDRKSTRLNSSHLGNSYAVFCLKKKRRRVGTWPLRRSHVKSNSA